MKKHPSLPTIKVFGKTVCLPKMRAMRLLLGIGFVCGGLLGALPILGFWMLPVGLFILSYDSPRIRRMRRRSEVWLMRRTRFCRWLKNLQKNNSIS